MIFEVYNQLIKTEFLEVPLTPNTPYSPLAKIHSVTFFPPT